MDWFLEPVPTEGGTGSGSIIDKNGYVLTNYHVVKDAYKLYINLDDGSQYEAEIIGKDPENDFAVVKFDSEGKDLITIPFGSSENLKVGQKVLAIGNPFGFDRTLTTGIVSGLGRPVRTSANLVIQGMIQTDASINPGNSGGPLLDSRGRMIGINTMIYTPSGGSVGIGFATPVDTAKRVIPDLINFGHVKRGWIDFYPVQLEPNIVRYGKLSVSKGLLVSKLSDNSNAAKAGIRGGDQNNPVQYGRSIIYFGGDIIINIDGIEINSLSDLFTSLENNKPGETVIVKLLRGKKEITTKVVLAERLYDFLAE
jgi:S1-C subfamily serine protease